MCVHEQTALSYIFRSCEATSAAIITEQTVITHDEHASNMPGFWLYLGRALGLVMDDGASPVATHQLPNFKYTKVKMQQD